jgi:hypothetical protein
MLKKINDCRNVTEAMVALQKSMNDSLYKKTADNNVQELSDAYYEMVRPKADLKNKIFDGRKETSRAVAPETPTENMGSDISNLVELTSACTRLDEINGDGSFSSTKKNYVSEGSPKTAVEQTTQ